MHISTHKNIMISLKRLKIVYRRKKNVQEMSHLYDYLELYVYSELLSARVEFRTVTLKILETLIIDSALQA